MAKDYFMDKVYKKFGIIFLGVTILGLSLTGFVIFGIIKLIQHFEII